MKMRGYGLWNGFNWLKPGLRGEFFSVVKKSLEATNKNVERLDSCIRV